MSYTKHEAFILSRIHHEHSSMHHRATRVASEFPFSVLDAARRLPGRVTCEAAVNAYRAQMAGTSIQSRSEAQQGTSSPCKTAYRFSCRATCAGHGVYDEIEAIRQCPVL